MEISVHSKQAITIVAILSGIVAGCAKLQTGEPSDIVAGRQFFNTLDDIVDDSQRRDVQAARISDFPNLRISHFLASFRDSITDRASLRFWYEILQSLDMEARLLEIKNISGRNEAMGSSCDRFCGQTPLRCADLFDRNFVSEE